MVQIEVNGKTIEAKPGEMLLTTLRRNGINVPTLCHIEGLFPSGSCRMCVVEVEGRPGLVPSCAFPVSPGLKVKTHSPRAVTARKTIIELLLANHPDDCLYCARNNTCELQKLAADLGVRHRVYHGTKSEYHIDASSPAIVRDPAKCILCGKCVRVCEEVQGVSAIEFTHRGSKTIVSTAFGEGLNVSACVNCGQCVMVCPTGALREKSSIREVLAALADPDKHVVVQHAPAVSVTVGELLGVKPGRDIMGLMTAAFRQMGFDTVFDTAFAADLTIMEEGSELVHRLQNNGPLPMFTSCSPGWVKFAEQFYPEFLPNVSTCKSPQQMMGAIIKSFFAEKIDVDPSKIYSVSIMPCTAKKFEANRPEMTQSGLSDIDAVLTTRELGELITMQGVDIHALDPQSADTPFGERSSAGKLFGASGGVMEAAIRSAHYLITGRELENLKVTAVRGMKGVKEAKVEIDGLVVGVAVVSGLGNARRLLDEIRAGRDDLHFVEIMTCPGGCIGGGGQPYHTDEGSVRARMKALYDIDRDADMRVSHGNKWIQRLYDEFLGKPLGHKSHELLHTKYEKRDVI
ncbi:MAG: NADH-dependent [FeFe] hydrogenase, group A6 [Candidatus Lernaella stagnicola]|nr:NADH-dependent [FeFe] hydrogenase, group A6 [Candidatus Lernaella stagnicola]